VFSNKEGGKPLLRNPAFASYATAKPGNNRTALSFSPDM